MSDSFYITGCGRSGTMFLSWIMNHSKKWTVAHEPEQASANRFEQQFYGEVNSNLRFFVKDLKVGKRGILIRDPRQIVVSMMNRRTSKQWTQSLHNIQDALDIIVQCVKDRFYQIDFSMMTSKVDYLQRVVEDFDIHDVTVTESMIQTVKNPSKSYAFGLHDLSQKQKDFVYEMEKSFSVLD